MRLYESMPSFIKNEARDSDQGERVHECGQHTGAMVAVGFYVIRGSGLKPEADRGQRDRESVGEIMSRVRDQSQAVGANAGEGLDRDKQDGRPKGPLQDLSSAMVVAVVVQIVSRNSILIP